MSNNFSRKNILTLKIKRINNSINKYILNLCCVFKISNKSLYCVASGLFIFIILMKSKIFVPFRRH